MTVLAVKALIHIAFLFAPAETRIVSARQIAETLATDLGQPVVVSRELADHRILLLRHGRSPDVALQALAACLRAHVEKDGQGYLVRRFPKELDALRAKQISDREKRLKANLAEIAEYRSAKLDGKDAGAAISEALEQDQKGFFDPAPRTPGGWQGPSAQYLLPAQSMLSAICESIGTKNLAQDSALQAQVYGDSADGPGKAIPNIEQILNDYNTAIKRQLSAKLTPNARQIADGFRISGMDWYDSLVSQNPAAHARLRVESSEDRISLSLEVYDANDMKIDSSFAGGEDTARVVSPAAILREFQGGVAFRSITLTKMALDAIHRAPVRGPMVPDWISRPATEDPLNLFLAPALTEIANGEPSTCTAFDVSDDLWNYSRYAVLEDRINVDALESIIKQSAEYEVVQQPLYTVWRPIFFDYSDGRLAARAALEHYGKRVASKEGADARDQAVLMHDAAPRVGGLTRVFSDITDGAWHGHEFVSGCLNRLIGGISEKDWEDLEAGKTIPLSDLGVSVEFKDLLDEDTVRVQSAAPIPDLYRHPLEFVGRGGVQATVSLATVQDAVVRQWKPPEKEPAPDMWMDVASLAGMVMYRPGQDGKPVTDFTREIFDRKFENRQFRLGFTKRQVFTIHLPNRCSITCALPEKMEKISDPLAYADFPSDIRDRLWDLAIQKGKDDFVALSAVMKANAAASPASPANPPPPPPR